MTSVVNLIRTTAYELAPAQVKMSPLLWSAFGCLNKVHSLWRYYRRIELYRQPESLAQMMVGHATAHWLGDVYILRLAAQCLLVATRIMECVEQQVSLYRAGVRLCGASAIHYDQTDPIKSSLG